MHYALSSRKTSEMILSYILLLIIYILNFTSSKIIYRVEVKMGRYNKMIIQFVEKEKRLKKGVDI